MNIGYNLSTQIYQNRLNFQSNKFHNQSKNMESLKEILDNPEKERKLIKGMYTTAAAIVLIPLAVEQGVNIKYNYNTKQQLKEIYMNPESINGETISFEEASQMKDIMQTKKETVNRMKLRLKERSELEKYHREMLDEFSDIESEDGVNISFSEQNKLDYKLDDKSEELVPYL